MAEAERFHTVVVGAGQAGLASAWYLKQAGVKFLVLEAQAQVGETWRNRWDSLRLFTPAKFNALPGSKFPGYDFFFPKKDDAAAYLAWYVERFNLPVRLNSAVDSLTRTAGGYLVTAGEVQFIAENVIVATGAYQKPRIPAFARELLPSIVQLHSHAYRNPDQLPSGNILVVGAGNSGAEIAIELARTGRTIWLSGRDVGRIPSDRVGRLFGGGPWWFFLSRILSVRTPIGRKARAKALRRGTPLIRLTAGHLAKAGVRRCGRVLGAEKGHPRFEDGRRLRVTGVVWATGYRYDFRWIRLPIFDNNGHPVHHLGVVAKAPGIYFVGLHFQRALTSALLGGVGIDAREIVRTITAGG